jgi:nucleoside-diphosphate-sugar epimerase
MANKILVTGGAGYIGSMLVPELLAKGNKVTVIDNFMFKQASLGHVMADKNFELIAGDVRDEKLMKEQVAKHDILVPLAALVGAPLCNKDPIAAETVNLQAPLAMMKMASKAQPILMPITNSAYGKGGAGNYCDETSPLYPISLYAKHKVEVEKVLMERENSISYRLATVFGMAPRMRLDLLVNDFVYRAVNDRFIVLFEGHFRRNYIHVRDVVAAFMHGMDKWETMRGNIYNVGLSDANLSKADLCNRIKKHVPNFTIMEAPIGEDPDKRDYLVSNDKIEKTGWRPKQSLDDGIQELIKGYRMIKNNTYANV